MHVAPACDPLRNRNTPSSHSFCKQRKKKLSMKSSLRRHGLPQDVSVLTHSKRDAPLPCDPDRQVDAARPHETPTRKCLQQHPSKLPRPGGPGTPSLSGRTGELRRAQTAERGSALGKDEPPAMSRRGGALKTYGRSSPSGKAPRCTTPTV